uniref:Uncharacterized protein n=1 Tax=Oryza rufipogon TaxID=4529 RepID=A0A0E0QQV5_ORYRU
MPGASAGTVAGGCIRRKSAPGDGIAVMSLTEKTRSKPSGLPARFGFDEMMFSLSSGYPCYQPWQEALRKFIDYTNGR